MRVFPSLPDGDAMIGHYLTERSHGCSYLSVWHVQDLCHKRVMLMVILAVLCTVVQGFFCFHILHFRSSLKLGDWTRGQFIACFSSDLRFWIPLYVIVTCFYHLFSYAVLLPLTYFFGQALVSLSFLLAFLRIKVLLRHRCGFYIDGFIFAVYCWSGFVMSKFGIVMSTLWLSLSFLLDGSSLAFLILLIVSRWKFSLSWSASLSGIKAFTIPSQSSFWYSCWKV